jgi:hypothetical protein
MKAFQLITMGVAMAAAAAYPAGAQSRPVGGPRITYPSHHNFSWERGHGFHALRQAQDERIFIVEREVPVVVEREVAPPPQAVPLPQKSGGEEKRRKPYVIGASYASLPGSCMKLIEEGVSFYYCSGEWYRQVGDGRSAMYRAVARKL